MRRVLVIEKEGHNALRLMLESEQFSPVFFNNVEDSQEWAAAENPGLMLLDLHCTSSIGPEICRRLRSASVRAPIIVLSDLSGDEHLLQWLEAGADDYVVKPFSMRELLARIHALLPRRKDFETTNVRRFADLNVDLTRRVVTRRGEELTLTPIEFNLLVCFLQKPDRVLTRNFLLNLVWGYEEFRKTRTVDNHIGRLRQKLEPDPSKPRYFLTEHGVGYRFLA